MYTILYLIYICATICAVKTNSTAENPPDITLLAKYNDRFKEYKVICVAGSSVVGTAITFITPLTQTFLTQNQISVSQYFVNDGSTLGKRFNCDFEFSSPCTERWVNNPEYKIKRNGEYNIIPVMDERWEKFETIYTDSSIKLVKIEPKFSNITQVSVRTSGEAIILLCEKDLKNVDTKCYSITIDENEFNNTRIKYCTHANEYYSNADSGCLNTENASIKEYLLSELEWKHFSISQMNDLITLTESTEGHITQFNTQYITFKTKFVYLTSKKKAAWKFHKFNYLSLENESEQFRKIGPTYTATKNELFCVTFYRALCTHCTLSIDFNTEVGIKYVDILQHTDTISTQSKWKKVRILIRTKANQRYNLYAINKKIGKTATAYWLIRDVRECNENETRKIAIDLTETELKSTSCQALNSPQWSVEQEDINTAPDIETHFCNDTQYIGKGCNISCNAVFGRNLNNDENCNLYSICKHTTAKILKCTCASGYFGDKCTKRCPDFMYGYNCKHYCGHCQKGRHCGKTSSTFPSKCEIGFEENQYCQTCNLPNSVSIKNVLFDITPTSIRIHWTPVCEKKIKIKVKCDKKINDWCIEIPHESSALSTEKEINIDYLIPYTNYTIQISDQNSILNDIEFTSKPSVPPKVRKLQVYSKSDNYISVRWQAPYPPHGNIEAYLLSTKATYPIKIQGEHCYLWDDYLCYKFVDLTSNNNYEIYIQSKNWNVRDLSEVIAFDTTTKEEKSQAPDHVTIYWDDQDVLILNWTHPNITNGDLVAFDITFDQSNTNLKENAFKTITSRLNISEPERTYQYKVKESLPFSSMYEISIQGINQERGEKVTKTVQTPPATPLLMGNVSTIEFTNTTRIITIPKADPFTISSTSYMVLTICDTQSKAVTGNIENIIRNISIAVNCSGAIRIAKGFEDLAMEGLTFQIGAGNGHRTQFKRMQINNEKLKQSENVYLVLVNEYHNQYRYTVLTIEDVPLKLKIAHITSYLLFSSLAILLIIVAIVGRCVYRHTQKKKRVSKTNDISMPNIESHSLTARYKLRTQNKNLEDERSKKLLLRNKKKSNRTLHRNII